MSAQTPPSQPGAARKTVREVVPFWEDDQILEPCLAATSALIRSGRLPPDHTPDVPW